ncbi:hypothetical protein PI125_g11729 [Phytophthora idaei]|nr:hypothetical protein PI125_g11729 [Phytophthora idaei]
MKSLYRLKEAPRAWHKALVQYLTSAGFEALQCEACIFTRVVKGKTQIVAICVDDLMLIAKSPAEIAEMKADIKNACLAKAMGPVSYILGIKVARDRSRRKLWINQQLSADTIVNRCNMQHTYAANVPSAPGKKLRKPANAEVTGDVAEMATMPFRQAVGSLNVFDDRVEARLGILHPGRQSVRLALIERHVNGCDNCTSVAVENLPILRVGA